MTPDRLAATALAVALQAQPDEIDEVVDRYMAASSPTSPRSGCKLMQECLREVRWEWLQEQREPAQVLQIRPEAQPHEVEAAPEGQSLADEAVQRLHAEAMHRFMRETAKPMNAYKRGEL